MRIMTCVQKEEGLAGERETQPYLQAEGGCCAFCSSLWIM